LVVFFFQAEDGIRDFHVTGVQTCALPISDVKFHDLGLVIVDEEQRFGVRQKVALKALRAEVHLLTLTATPIPRTLNMAMSGLREIGRASCRDRVWISGRRDALTGNAEESQ